MSGVQKFLTSSSSMRMKLKIRYFISWIAEIPTWIHPLWSLCWVCSGCPARRGWRLPPRSPSQALRWTASSASSQLNQLWFSTCFHHQFAHHLFCLGDLEDVVDVDLGVDGHWFAWDWQIPCVALSRTSYCTSSCLQLPQICTAYDSVWLYCLPPRHVCHQGLERQLLSLSLIDREKGVQAPPWFETNWLHSEFSYMLSKVFLNVLFHISSSGWF